MYLRVNALLYCDFFSDKPYKMVTLTIPIKIRKNCGYPNESSRVRKGI